MLHNSRDISVNPTNLFMSETDGDKAYTAFKLYFLNNIQGYLTVVYKKSLGLCLSFCFTGFALASCFVTELP